MTHFRFFVLALGAALMIAAPSNSSAQTYYSNSQVYSSPVISAPVTTFQSSPVVSTPVVSSYPTTTYSSYPVSNYQTVSGSPVTYYQAPFVAPATNVYQGHTYAPQPLYVSPGANNRVQRYYANSPRTYHDGQTLYVTGPLGFTSRRRTPLGQASYYQGQADRLERAYTGESRDQQEMRRYRAARQEFNARTYQRFPNNPLMRLGTNMFFGPSNPSDD